MAPAFLSSIWDLLLVGFIKLGWVCVWGGGGLLALIADYE